MQACKPGSVSRHRRDSYHLSGPDVTTGINRPTHSTLKRLSEQLFPARREAEFIWSFSP